MFRRTCVLTLLSSFLGLTASGDAPAAENLALKATASATSEFDTELSATNVIDGRISDEGSRHDHKASWAVKGKTANDSAELILQWNQPVELAELVYFGRTAFSVRECWKQYEVWLDDDTKPVAKGKLEARHGPQRISFTTRTCQQARLRFLCSYGGANPGAAEIMAFARPLSDEEFAGLPGAPEPLGPPAQGPNVILFIADDVSVDDIGCYGHPTIRTPNIDRLAARGMRFTNAYLTTSQCSPSRCSILSGRYPHNHGAPELHMELPADQPMFARQLKDAGYWCVQAGKWHMGEPAKVAFHRVWGGQGGGPGAEGRWLQCLQERPKDRPFFAWFASIDAHRSWQPDPDGEPHTRDDAVIPPYLVDSQPTRDDLRQYYDEIQRFDRFIGLCLDEVKRQGELDNTMVIVMADNGRPFPRCKTRLYDSGLKTPFIVAYPPMVKKPTVCDSLVSAIDIAPTILDLANLETPAAMQGVSFLPLLEDPKQMVRQYVFGEHNWHDFKAHERMCCDGRFLYIRNSLPQLPASQPGQALAQEGAYLSLVAGHQADTLISPQQDIFVEPRAPEELFKLTDDYHQLTNLVGDVKHPETLARMRTLLDRWIEETGDTCPDDLTVDVCDRHNKNSIIAQPDGTRSMRPYRRGITPGSERNATAINKPGPR